MQFELSNDMYNMGPYNWDLSDYTVNAMDYIFDDLAKKNICFVVTKQISYDPNFQQLIHPYELVLNVVRFQPLVYQWSEKQ